MQRNSAFFQPPLSPRSRARRSDKHDAPNKQVIAHKERRVCRGPWLSASMLLPGGAGRSSVIGYLLRCFFLVVQSNAIQLDAAAGLRVLGGKNICDVLIDSGEEAVPNNAHSKKNLLGKCVVRKNYFISSPNIDSATRISDKLGRCRTNLLIKSCLNGALKEMTRKQQHCSGIC